jgi:oxepin-CoA hydrolase/3-oxo-5,6-dehydrosuberyl-CoA semialdehyde dehydrogenase
METLRSYVAGRWHTADAGFTPLVDPATEEVVARASTQGVDFADVWRHALARGGPALRELGFAGRAGLVKEMGRVLREHRDELLELSRVNTGTTRPDGAFDVDGASGTLAWYAGFGRRLGDGNLLAEDEGTQLARSEGFWGRHGLLPRRGVAVCINAFNFPVWGFAEKAACALIAGMPVVVKPATATAWVAARAVEIVLAAGILPEGALQLLCGSTGDLLDRLGPQDVLAFTGSADTARGLRGRPHLQAAGTRINVEADSLNAAVLAPSASADAVELFHRDVRREITQKTGQKCTAVRRVLVPAERLDEVGERLVASLSEVVAGNAADAAVTMGPLATGDQLAATEEVVARLAEVARVVHGTGRRVDGVGSPAGKGYFFAPTLLRADHPQAALAVHREEAFAPVATLLPYDGSAAEAAQVVALAGGTLVTSVYGDDPGWIADFVAAAGPTTGRVYIGSAGSAEAAPGSGIALPQSLHGGPGRAGGGEELGGMAGLRLYLQRVALQGSRQVVEGLTGTPGG